ncbi:hypothetical protein AYO21_00653 [Fonsecaea monophora]|uniref:Protein kinase domain-containing protein n=1 Tax=Fonsecaea monophora TaxID=254056 RepID=A0A177FM17_9EURO|nr:hypothetical protein AYO21_00653 [Fonsecaea monophora]KAH0840690.1 hypothetical protein FOPE_06041 [Fonsecaea pedrosoi]OAG45305.1 hypothetical protein AYO21_00653 [Fonsecaea monophora]
MKDGFEVLARLPYPSTKPCRLAIASEVATLDLVHAAGVPAPKILYYSTDAQNPVEADSLIMEKLRGRPIGDMYPVLDLKFTKWALGTFNGHGDEANRWRDSPKDPTPPAGSHLFL